MWLTIKNNYKIILATAGILLAGIILAFLFEDYYRQLVRFSFKFFNGDSIQFMGKNFHLFASGSFIFAFGLFLSSSFLLLKSTSLVKRIKRTLLTVIIFFGTTVIITALDSMGLVAECTACNDGIRRITYNQITYDKYFIISLSVALLYLLAAFLLERKRLSKTMETLS